MEASLVVDDSSQRDKEIQALRVELAEVNKEYMEILEEKNRIYEDLTPQIKELLRLNTQIQTSSSESARLK